MKFIMFILIITLSAFVPAYAEYEVNNDSMDDSDKTDKKQIFHIVDDVALKPEVKIQYDKPRIVIKAVYPYIFSATEDENIDSFNRQINDIIQEEVTNFRVKVMENRDSQLERTRSAIKNDLTLDFNTSVINTNGNPIVCIRFTIHGSITGVTHPYHIHRVFNYDLYNGERLQLADLFNPDSDYLSVMSNYTQAVLSKRLKDRNAITTGTEAKEENFKNWNITPFGLLITFDEAQVAPTVYGTQTVLIPYAILKQILANNSAAMGCARHRKNCIRNNVLTGGFIDEAATVPAKAHLASFSPSPLPSPATTFRNFYSSDGGREREFRSKT